MIFNFALGVFVLSVISMTLCIVSPIAVREKTVRKIWIVFVISFSIFIYFNDPLISTDLWRHYYCMDEIRNHIMPTMYGAEYGFIAFLWVLTLIGKNRILPSVAFMITGFMIDKIYQEYKKQYKDIAIIKPKTLILYYFMALSGLNISYIVSSVRSALICVIFIWAYVKFFKTNKKWYYIIGFLLGTIHIMSFMLLFFAEISRAINKVEKRKRILVIFLLALVGIRAGLQTGIIVLLASMLPGNLGNLVYMKVIGYGAAIQSQGLPQLPVLVSNVVFSFSLAVSLCYTRKQDSFVFLLSFISLFGGLQEAVDSRLIQATGLLMIPALQINGTRLKGGVNYIYHIIIYFSCLLSCFYCFYSLCAHMTLNGVNYRDILANILGI